MKTSPSDSFQIAIVLAVLLLLTSGSLAHAATVTWTNTSGGNWSVAANWNPNQVPTNTDNVLITTPGTYTVTLDVFDTSYNATNAANLTLGAGGGAAGVQSLRLTTLLSSQFINVGSLLVTNGGVLQITNGFLAGNLIIDQGGVLNGAGETFEGSLTIQNGGVLNTANGDLGSTITVTNGGVLHARNDSFGPVTVANGGLMTVVDVAFGSLTVAHGGVLDIWHDPAIVFATTGIVRPVINAGTINLTNSAMDFWDPPWGTGGLVNQPGGVVTVQGSSTIGLNGEGYFINQGALIESAGPGSTVNFVNYFDNSQGTVTNLSGTLVLGTYQTNLAGIYYAAAGATNQFFGANNATPMTPGVPFVLGGSGQHQFIAGFLELTTQAYPNLALIADRLVLGPAFQGGAITNLALDGIALSNSLPVTGTLAATNSGIVGNFTVSNGGVFTGSNAGTYGSVTVANGGLYSANGGSVYGALSVAHGAIVNLTGTIDMSALLTNAGTVNISNASIDVNVGIINQARGLVNLGNNVGIYAGYYDYGIFFIDNPNAYFINQGMVVQMPGTATTNTISCPASAQVGNQQISINLAFNFDNSQGTITNFSGTLALPGFRTNLAGTFYAAAGTTIQLGGGIAATPLTPGTPLVLGGSGQYQFYSGYLYLPTNAIPNLSLQAGLLELGPGFQGGAITNLELDGIALTNQLSTTLPIQGAFTVLNTFASLNNPQFVGWDGFYGTGVYGDYTVAGGGVLTASNSLMHGSVSVANGGVFNDGATVNGTVTVAGGGAVNANGALMNGAMTVANGGLMTATRGGAVINRGSSLTMAAASTMNITGGGIVLNGPLNNAGTINITNPAGSFSSGISSFNNSLDNNSVSIFGTNLGGVFNQTSGLINLGSDSTSLSTRGGGYEYIVNQGTIIKSAGTNFSSLSVPFLTNSGAITIQSGVFHMKPFVMLPGGSLNVGLNSATNYGSFIVTTTGPVLTGTQPLAGAFIVILNNGYVPSNGTIFNVLFYGSFTGNFTSLGLPSTVSWQSTYGSTNFTLVAGSPQPQFATFNLSGTNLIFNGTGGSPGSNYVMLASTNVTIPLTNWLALTTNTFDGSGQFRYTNNVSPAKPQQFFIFKSP